MLDRGIAFETFCTQLKGGLGKLRRTQLARDAAWLLIFNVTSRAIAFFGTAYGARCLGPVNLGISAVVQTTAQQAALIYNGGFDTIGAREIAADQKCCPAVTETVILFRLCLALVASVIWAIFTFMVIGESQRLAWLLGVPLMLTTASGIVFAFQGLEKLPIQSAITAGGALLTSAAYFLFFTRGMFLGADLIVISSVGLVVVVISWAAYFRLFRCLPLGKTTMQQVFSLLHESWRYWILAVLVYFYSVFQIPLVAWLLGAREVGIFRSAFLMAAGLDLFFGSINNLLLPRLVIWRQQGLQVMWRKQSRLLLIFVGIGIPTVTAAILVAPFVYRVLLGEAFTGGIVVFQILAVGRLVVFLGQIYAWGLAATRQDTHFLFACLSGAVSNVALNLVCIPHFGLRGVAVVSLASESLVVSSCYFFMRRFVLGSEPTIGKDK
jgi:O-antigen/teichoic acid export membrane protein